MYRAGLFIAEYDRTILSQDGGDDYAAAAPACRGRSSTARR